MLVYDLGRCDERTGDNAWLCRLVSRHIIFCATVLLRAHSVSNRAHDRRYPFTGPENLIREMRPPDFQNNLVTEIGIARRSDT